MAAFTGSASAPTLTFDGYEQQLFLLRDCGHKHLNPGPPDHALDVVGWHVQGAFPCAHPQATGSGNA